MASITERQALDKILDPVGQCLTKDVAARIVALRADAKLQMRMNELADKNTEGTLTPEEDTEYSIYLEALDFITILQARARKTLKALSRSK